MAGHIEAESGRALNLPFWAPAEFRISSLASRLCSSSRPGTYYRGGWFMSLGIHMHCNILQKWQLVQGGTITRAGTP